MQVHARISKEWRRRMFFMGFMIWGSSAWFAYDGYVAWPAEEQRYQQLVELTADVVEKGEEPTEKNPEVKRIWRNHAEENDLKSKVPKHRSDGDLAGQRYIAGFFAIGGVFFSFWVWRQHQKSVRAEGEVITGADGETVRFDEIVDMDRSKWESKGIAYAIYERDERRRKLCLDDHKFMGAEAIILEAEKRLQAAYSPADGKTSAADEEAAK